MDRDEQQIRDLIDSWIAASKAGDMQRVLGLITEDVVFLQPGQPPMRKAAFAKAQAEQKGIDLEVDSQVEEIRVSGDLAYAWTRLAVAMTPPGAAHMKRAGFTLTVFRKEGGQWLLARDANLLAPVP
ncbi:MAG TPA: SgcJ/EcaC family oxidoreductase [Solimonas sp.]|nr:SgcJ/EcaC family oxidoreductase [Solimonas sp.]